MDKYLGKIESAEYGIVKDAGHLFGLQLSFLFDGCGCGDGCKYTVNLYERCKWDYQQQRSETIVKQVEFVKKILEDAKVHHISQLKGKPVEVMVENCGFRDFRILTEVL